MTSTGDNTEGFDIVANGATECIADLELSAIFAAGFHKANYPEHTVQIRNRSNGVTRTVLGYARLV